MNNDDLFFYDDESSSANSPQKPTWKVLIIDDEEDIHQVTKLVLKNFNLEGASLEFFSVYSAEEAKTLLQKEQDIAVAFVDVVMETNHAGLDLVKYIRNELNNRIIRLVLRTGQPGEAPEESVIRDFDINDYKNKTELTDIKLKTLMYTALRSYRDLLTIKKHQEGLEKIIASTANFLECSTLKQFGSVVLEQIAEVLGLQNDKIYCCVAVNKNQQETNFEIVALSDNEQTDISAVNTIPDSVTNLFEKAHKTKRSLRDDSFFTGYFTSSKGSENLLYVSHSEELNQSQHDLLEFFSNNIGIVYDNIRMRELIKDSQRELSYILGEAVEKRSKETGCHVKRVANYSFLLADLYGLTKHECEVIKLASPLHDVGKVGIPDAVLNKPAKLDLEEWAIMQTHATLGYEVLNQSENEILKMGAIIAHQHHEKFDGSGYPQGLKGQNIDIAGRITAIADVFDALASSRCYKKAWPLENVLELLKEEKGKHFDPQLVDLLLDNLDEFLEIRKRYPDVSEGD